MLNLVGRGQACTAVAWLFCHVRCHVRIMCAFFGACGYIVARIHNVIVACVGEDVVATEDFFVEFDVLNLVWSMRRKCVVVLSCAWSCAYYVRIFSVWGACLDHARCLLHSVIFGAFV